MTSFEIKGKVALITGGASGLGYLYAVELLKKGAKGVTLADVSKDVGQDAVKSLSDQFGANRAIFVATDVTSYEQYENAFKTTISTFNNVDILINNAGIMNDAVWKKEIDINLNGTINGILLGLEKYLPKYKSGDEGVIINISSLAGLFPLQFLPIYSGTKAAVVMLTLSWGQSCHYDRSKVRVVALCPGKTDTPLISDATNRNLGEAYEAIQSTHLKLIPNQAPEICAEHAMDVIEKAPNGTLWIINNGEKAYRYEPSSWVIPVESREHL